MLKSEVRTWLCDRMFKRCGAVTYHEILHFLSLYLSLHTVKCVCVVTMGKLAVLVVARKRMKIRK